MESEKTYRVMVVDDNDDVRRLLRKVLEAAGHEVVEVADGEGAISRVEESVPDLVLMDIRLPGGMDGLETTSRLKEDPRLKRVPIIALTASVMERDRQQAVAAGCSGFIGKPVDVATLPDLVKKFIARGPASH
ncbi:MAG: response regulator [Gaiellales bacterium]|nr:MAG: response regulator [Gaiellales bacterium]